MKLTDEQRTRLAPSFHEAGHAVVGVLHGAEIHRAEVVRGGPRTNPGGVAGFCRYEPFGIEATARHREITAAGTIAEAVLWFGSGGMQPMVPTAEVLPLITRTWPSIAELATRLTKHGSIDHKDVLTALSIPAGASPDVVAHYAASIRSGSVPGSFTITRAAV